VWLVILARLARYEWAARRRLPVKILEIKGLAEERAPYMTPFLPLGTNLPQNLRLLRYRCAINVARVLNGASEAFLAGWRIPAVPEAEFPAAGLRSAGLRSAGLLATGYTQAGVVPA
jgi:hypothetical protein